MAFGNLVVAQSYSEFQQAASDLIGHGAASRGGEGNTAAAPPQSRLATAAMRITPAPAAPSGGEPGRPEEAQTQAGGGADDSDTEG